MTSPTRATRPQRAPLRAWTAFRQELIRLERGAAPEIGWFSELGAVIRDYDLPFRLFHDLLSAFSQDVVKTRYANHAEVIDYCRRSANPVGRLLLGLYGAERDARTVAQSDAICSSLQLINFRQDVAVDIARAASTCRGGPGAIWRERGAECPRRTGGAWRELMAFEIERARMLMTEGSPLGRALAGRIGLEIRTTVGGGGASSKRSNCRRRRVRPPAGAAAARLAAHACARFE